MPAGTESVEQARETPLRGTLLYTDTFRRIHTWRLVFAGITLTGLAAVAVITVAGQPSHRLVVDVSSLPRKQASAGVRCFVDGLGGKLMEYPLSSDACTRYTVEGMTYHGMALRAECSKMKEASDTYQDASCCTTDLCNGDQDKNDITCYADGPTGTLVTVKYQRSSDMVCAKYTFGGKVVHSPVAPGTCETMKRASAIYRDVLCCTTDLCNAE